MNNLGEKVDSAKFWRSFLTVMGAVVSAVGSASAGFATKRGVRKISAVVGAIGAVVASLPALVPESSDLARAQKLSEQHKLFADKVWIQIATLETPTYIGECTRYTLARYASCTSLVPEETVPPLPEPSHSQQFLLNLPATHEASLAHFHPSIDMREIVQRYLSNDVKSLHAAPEDPGAGPRIAPVLAGPQPRRETIMKTND